MLCFVGGASRSGKSLLASRMGLPRGVPALGFDPETDDLDEAARMWPTVRAMAENLIDDGRDYLIEGVCLRPGDVAPFVRTGAARVLPRLS